jgi:hypothetical protein
VASNSEELMMSASMGPVEKMLNAVPYSPKKVREQVAQFR